MLNVVPNGGTKRKKGLDRNPAPFNIQYPMKNHIRIFKWHADW